MFSRRGTYKATCFVYRVIVGTMRIPKTTDCSSPPPPPPPLVPAAPVSHPIPLYTEVSLLTTLAEVCRKADCQQSRRCLFLCCLDCVG